MRVKDECLQSCAEWEEERRVAPCGLKRLRRRQGSARFARVSRPMRVKETCVPLLALPGIKGESPHAG